MEIGKIMTCSRSHRRLMAVYAASAVVVACGDPARPAAGPVIARADELLEQARSVTPQQSADSPIVRISGIDFDSAGRFLIGDVSEGNVKLFAPDGRKLRTFGRKGEGPGEFIDPRYPRFHNDSIYVADSNDATVTVFDSTEDTLPEIISLERVVHLMGFDVLTTGEFVAAGWFADADSNVVGVFDRQGSLLRTMVPARHTLPRGGQDSPIWNHIRLFHMTLHRDTVYLVATVSDSLWTVVPTQNRASARSLPLSSDYVPPFLQDDRPRDVRGLTEWTKQFHLAAPPLVSAAFVAVPFVKGVLNYGDPNILLVTVKESGRSYLLHDVAPPVTTSGQIIVAIERPDADTTVLAMFRLRN